MRLLRVFGWPKPLSGPKEIFDEVDRLAPNCPWKSEEEKKSFETPLRMFVFVFFFLFFWGGG